LKRIISGILAAVLVLLLYGCKDNTDTKKEEKNEGKQISAEMSIFSYKPDTLCPILTQNEANIHMLGVVYESLISLSDALCPEPCLANTWSVSEDGRVWTLNLRSDVSWHSGETFGARDVVFTVEKIKENENSVYYYNVSNIKNIRATGESVLEIEVEKPWANFINLLYFPIIKYGEGEINSQSFVPVGTGPYKFEDRNEGNMYYLVRNDSWWGEAPDTERITVKLLPDNGTALYTFSSGGIDITPADDMNWGRFADPVSTSFVSIPTPIFHFVGINHENDVLRFKEIREAISGAIDREKIIEETMTGYATASAMPIHPQWFVCGDKKLETKKNIDKAVKLLEKNDWKKSGNVFRKTVEEETYIAELKILVNEENEQRVNIASFVETDLEELGFSVGVEKLPFEEYSEKIAEGEYDLFIGSYIVPPDLKFSFITGDGNMFRFENEDMSAAMNALGTKYSLSGVEEGYGAVIDCFDNLNPVVGLFFENEIMLYSNRIKGDVTPSYFELYRGIESLRKETAEK